MGKHNHLQRKAYKKRRKALKAIEKKAKKAAETNSDGQTDRSSVVTECSNSSCYCRGTDIKTLESSSASMPSASSSCIKEIKRSKIPKKIENDPLYLKMIEYNLHKRRIRQIESSIIC